MESERGTPFCSSFKFTHLTHTLYLGSNVSVMFQTASSIGQIGHLPGAMHLKTTEEVLVLFSLINLIFTSGKLFFFDVVGSLEFLECSSWEL
jgi:hypothetical protein